MIVRRETLNAVLPATSSEDTRYNLAAVHLEPANKRAVATNGFVLLIATDPSPFPDEEFPEVPGAEFHGDPGPVTVSADVVRGMIATMPKKSTLPILGTCQVSRNGSETTATITATDLHAPRTAKIDTADGKQFPDYARVLSKADRLTVPVTFAVDILETLIKSAKAVAGTGKHAKPAHITFAIPIGRKDRYVPQTRDPKTGEWIDGKPGAVEAGVGITINGTSGITVHGVAMPIRTVR